RDPPRDLYHERDRVDTVTAAQRDAQARRLSERRLAAEGAVSGTHEGPGALDDAHQGVAAGAVPLLNCVPGARAARSRRRIVRAIYTLNRTVPRFLSSRASLPCHPAH